MRFSKITIFLCAAIFLLTECGRPVRQAPPDNDTESRASGSDERQVLEKETNPVDTSADSSSHARSDPGMDALPPIPREDEPPRPPVQKGAALGLYSEDPEWSYINFLQEMKEAGVSHVAIVVPWYMKTSTEVKIFKHPRYTVPMRTVMRTVNDAREQGLEVFLFPILRVEDKSNGGWRGTLKPHDVDLFYQNYLHFILKFAKLAERLQIPLLSIGSELSSMDIDTAQWRHIIDEVRKVYSGKLTYSANWDHYTEVKFFDQLDYAGVTGYFELVGEEEDPTVERLIRGWQRVQMQLLPWQKKIGKPLILTEVGYLSQKLAAAWPWKEAADNTIDLELQRRCYEAVRRAWNGKRELTGLYFWNWFGWGGSTSKEYTPRNKPAANEVKKWYVGKSADKEKPKND